jgi:hypothetical protein
VTVNAVKIEDTNSAKVYHSFANDVTWGSYVTLVEVEGDQVRVGTPLACGEGLSHVEVYSVVQLILGKPVIIQATPLDTVVSVEERGCPRDWKAYRLSV